MMRKFLLTTIIHFLSFLSWSQQGKAALSQPVIEIGEAFTLTYAFPIKGNQTNVKFSPSTSFLKALTPEGNSVNESIEVFSEFRDTIMDLEDGSYWIGVYELQCWDSGEFIVPPATINLNGKAYELPKVAIKCNLLPHQSTLDIYDIQENFVDLPEVKRNWNSVLKSYWWLFILFLILLVGFILWRNKRRKNVHSHETQRPLTLEDQTLLAIDELMQKKLWKQDQLKEHYVELSHILKGFLSKLLNLELKERTTTETVLLLKQQGLNDELLSKINLILQQADLVKFAQSGVVEEGVINTTNLTKSVVHEMSKLQSNYD